MLTGTLQGTTWTASQRLFTAFNHATRVIERPDLRPSLADRLPVIAFVVVTCAAILPLLLLENLPIVDWPNHLARMHVLGAVPTDTIRQTYAPHWALMPDLGCDAIYYALSDIVSPETCLRLYLIGSVLMLLAAMWNIHVTHYGSTGFAMAFSPLLVTGLSVYMGYLNYILSIALAFVGLAFYFSWRERPTQSRIACLSIIAALTWCAHLAGFAAFGVMLTVIVLAEPVSPGTGGTGALLRRIGTLSSIFGPVLVLSRLAEKQNGNFNVHYHEAMKLRFLLAPWVATGSSADLLAFVVSLTVVFLVARRGFLEVAANVRMPVLALCLLVVVCPYQIGDAVDVDSRLVLPLTALVLAGTRTRLPRRAVSHVIPVLLLLTLMSLRWIGAFAAGRENSHEVAVFRSLAARLPVGSALMVARDVDNRHECKLPLPIANPPLTHLASYAAIDRAIYDPLIFTGVGMQPLQTVKPPFAAHAHAMSPTSFALVAAVTRAGSIGNLLASPPQDADLATEARELDKQATAEAFRFWPAHFDALLVLHDGCVRNLMPSQLKLLGAGHFFSLFEVVHHAS